jgi:hypothetical protein
VDKFILEEDLSQLVASSGLSTSYAGSIATGIVPVPEPGTLALMGLGLAGLAVKGFRRGK